MKINRKKKTRFTLVIVALLAASIILVTNYSNFLFKADTLGESQVANLTTNAGVSGSNITLDSNNVPQVPRYDEFEATFDINWTNGSGVKYDPLASEWTSSASYKTGDSVQENNEIYVAQKDVPSNWMTSGGYKTGDTVINGDKAYQAVKDTPQTWTSGNTYKRGDVVIYNDLVWINARGSINGDVAKGGFGDGNCPGPATWNSNYLCNTAYLWDSVGDGNIQMLTPGAIDESVNFWQEISLTSFDIEPNVGANWQYFWADSGRKTINPYWPYDPSPSVNQYWQNTNNWNADSNGVGHPNWDANTDYTGGDSHVINNGNDYACIKSTPKTWVLSTDNNTVRYDENSEVKHFNSGVENIYTSIYNTSYVATADTEPNVGANWQTYWKLKGTENDYLNPGNNTNKWQEYWQAIPADYQAVPAGQGVSVDGIFTSSTGQVVDQPAFYYQNYDFENYTQTSDDYPWLSPVGKPVWKIRFTPPSEGTWTYKIQVTDRTGSTIYQTNSTTLNCTSSTNRGFVEVSPLDNRYFATDETPGGNYLNFNGLEIPKVVESNGTLGGNSYYDWNNTFQTMGSNGLNGDRVWWNATGGGGDSIPLLGTQTSHWHNMSLTNTETRPGELFSDNLASVISNNSSLSSDQFTVKENTTYELSAWVKTVNLTGTGDYGVQISAGHYGTNTGTSENVSDTGGGWKQISVRYITGNDSYWNAITVSTPGVTGGNAYITDISLKEVLPDGLGPEVLWTPNFDATSALPQQQSWLADQQVEMAQKNGVYLKVSLFEKNDAEFDEIQADGTIGTSSPDNFYANDNHAGRTYQQYDLRYIIARYGYSTAIQSFEPCNESDPTDGNNMGSNLPAFTEYFNNNDPNHHLTTTSNWTPSGWRSSLIVGPIWNDPNHGSYIDIHRYVGNDVGANGPDTYLGFSNAIGGNGGDTAPFGPWQDGSVYRSPPYSAHVYGDSKDHTDPADSEYYENVIVQGQPFPIKAGDSYTLTYYMKSQNLTQPQTRIDQQNKAASLGFGIHPTSFISEGGIDIPIQDTSGVAFMNGTMDWTKSTVTFTSPTNGNYLALNPQYFQMRGDLWFDDITLHDDTTNQDVMVPNGNFDDTRVDFDTALISYDLGSQVGQGSTRTVSKPVMDSNIGIVGGNGCPPTGCSGEDPELSLDTEGIWYRKLIWGQINPYGVMSWYYWNENIMLKGLYKYTKAYSNFLSDISLANGKYKDAVATTSDNNLRAWGQKEVLIDGKADKADLWLDNAPYTWKAVIDHNYWANNHTVADVSIDAPNYDSGISYYDGDHVTYNGAWYVSDRNSNSGNTPNSNPNWWSPVTNWWDVINSPGPNPALPTAIPDTDTVTIPNMEPSKTYNLQWWDTTSGQAIASGDQEISGASLTATSDSSGNLTFNTPSITSDIALKITLSSVSLNPPTISNYDASKNVTYKSTYHLTGTKTSDVTKILINGTEISNSSYTSTTWSGDVSLSNISINNTGGDNTINIVGEDDSGDLSNPITITLNRHKQGDTNGDGVVNYLDLSKLAISWNKDVSSGTNYLADFDGNNTIDIFDFSILATNWKK